MARIAKQTEYNAQTIAGLLKRWQAIPADMTNITGDKLPLDFAVPKSREAFTPNAHLMYQLLRALSGSVRQHFAGTGANYNSFMSMYSRWKLDRRDFQDWQAEISRYPDKHAALVATNSDAFIKARDDLRLKSVEGWVSYEAWVRMLGKARVLSAPVIATIPRSLPRVREGLQRMYGEWLAMTDTGEEAHAEPVDDSLPVVGIKLGSRGDVAIPAAIWNAVATVEEQDGAVFDTEVSGNDCIIAWCVRGDVRASLAGRVFINCIFKDVTFHGSLAGATFILCDFEGDCKLATGIDAEGITFKKCQTLDAPLGMANLTLTGLRVFQCDGMRMNLRRSGVTNSHVTDGWVDCGRRPEDAGMTDAERVAPRTVTGSVWQNGGLDYDLQRVPDSEINDNTGEGLVKVLVAPASRVVTVHSPVHAGALDNCAAVAESLLMDRLWTTRKVAMYQWQVASEDEMRALMEEGERRLRGRRTAQTEPAPAVPRETESGMSELERAIARG